MQPDSVIESTEARDQRRREASIRYRQRVQQLLARRRDLEGVSELADLISDGTRWAA